MSFEHALPERSFQLLNLQADRRLRAQKLRRAGAQASRPGHGQKHAQQRAVERLAHAIVFNHG
jgi:hypothetical protein